MSGGPPRAESIHSGGMFQQPENYPYMSNRAGAILTVVAASAWRGRFDAVASCMRSSDQIYSSSGGARIAHDTKEENESELPGLPQRECSDKHCNPRGQLMSDPARNEPPFSGGSPLALDIYDVEVLRRAAIKAGWSAEYRQLGAGPLTVRSVAIQCAGVLMVAQRADRSMEVVGKPVRVNDSETLGLGNY